MILTLLVHVTEKKQTTNNVAVLTLSGKSLLFHNEIANANKRGQFNCTLLLHSSRRTLLPWAGVVQYPAEPHLSYSAGFP